MFPRLPVQALTTRVRILRNDPISSEGISTEPRTISEDIFIAPIDPISNDTIERFHLETPIDLWESACNIDVPLRNGDIIYDYETQISYNVRNAAPWTGSHYEILLERVKST